SGANAVARRELWAASNQHVSFQLAVRSSQTQRMLTADVTPPEDHQGQKILTVTIHPVGYVVVGSHSTDTPDEELAGEAPGWYPDPIVDFPIDLKPNQTRSFWITIHVPPNAKPGDYRTEITVNAGGHLLVRSEFRLNVVEAAVPEERSL